VDLKCIGIEASSSVDLKVKPNWELIRRNQDKLFAGAYKEDYFSLCSADKDRW
jgi:hypothetical protein